ncbi:MAG TPA: ABC transporter permease subunit [Chloroflexi bacterium]|nr:ABC transporter permease subunit [Chloroflexota bacterium]
MFVEFTRTIRKFRGIIIGWGIGLAVYSLLMVGIYSDIALIDFSGYLASFPEELMAFLGSSFTSLSAPEGYLDVCFFNIMMVIMGILAVGAGAKLLSQGEGDGVPDPILSYPAGRSGIFWGRVLGFLATLVILLTIAWLSWAIPAGASGLDLTALELARPFLPLLAQLALFGFLAILLSQVLPSSRMASMFTGAALVGNYLLVGLANIYPDLEKISRITPIHIYQGGKAISGLNTDWLIILAELVVLFLLLGWYLFLIRDNRVIGEGGWKLSFHHSADKTEHDIPFLRRLNQSVSFLFPRLVFGLLVLAFITYASFLGLDMARGVPFKQAAGDSVVKTMDYASDALRGDLGETSSGSVSLLSKPVVEVIPDVLIRSLGLLGVSLLVSAVVGVILAVLIAGRRSGITLAALMVSIVGVSVPSFFAALLLQMGTIKLTQFYGKSLLPVGGFGWDDHLILPVLVLAARPLAQITRVTYITVEDILKQDYVRTAYSKGLRSIYVMAVHITRNAAVPVLTTIGLSLRFALSSLPIVEYFFGWQGLGYTLLQSISNRDDDLTIGLALCLGILFILVNLFLDWSYILIDPRLRDQGANVRGGKKGFWGFWKNLIKNVRTFLADKPWLRWLPGKKEASQSPFREIIDQREDGFTYYDTLAMGKARLRVWLKGTLGNPALLIGVVIVTSLALVMFFSPQLSPHSPYQTQGLTIEDGELLVPPFKPDKVYPWGTDPLGRDIMSLILSGAQQTFTLAIFVVVVRLVVGFLLGALAGWFSGSWLDRFVLGASETIAAFPALLLVMVLILGIGIRQGMQPFIIAMSFIGWSEIMQYVRSKVLEIKPQLFIESAEAAGAHSGRILGKHVFPNIIPGLVSILSLEMGAVLMLLGELGFIGIFIGGGAFAEIEIWGPPYHYSDVPEWGALLSNIRLYARSYPWTALYPAGAFFVAITGFNFLGEGIRRFIETVGIAATRLIINKYTLAVFGLLAGVFFWFRGTTGSTAIFIQQAESFQGERAYAYLDILSDPRWEGRSLGTAGMDQAAAYIAGEFEALGLQPAGEEFTYFQTRTREFEYLTREPTLKFYDGSPELVYHEDFVEFVGYYQNLGSAKGEMVFLGLGDLMQTGQWFRNFPALDELDFSGQIVVVLNERDAGILHDIPKDGLLIVTEDESLINQRTTLSARSPFFNPFGSTETIGQNTPILRISTEVANNLLEGTGYQVNSLKIRVDDLKQDECLIIPTGIEAAMTVQGSVVEDFEVRNVIGHLPGNKGDPKAQMDNKLVVVMAQYDSPPLIRGASAPQAANNNASGVALMLELIRTMQESGYQPNRTFLFIAYAGEGQEGGEWVYPDISKFLQAKGGFSKYLDLEAIIGIRGVGAGGGEEVMLSTQGSLRLVELFESSARKLGIPVTKADSQVDLSILFNEGNNVPVAEASFVGVHWEEWWDTGGTMDDNMDTIDLEKLQQAGEVLSLGVMVMGYELNY